MAKVERGLEFIQNKIQEAIQAEATLLNSYIARYLLHTGYKIDQVVLVRKDAPDGYRFWIEPKLPSDIVVTTPAED